MDRPRVALLLAMTLCYLTRSDGESEIVLIGVSVVAPFWESEQLRSHEETSDFNVETDQPRVQVNGPLPEGFVPLSSLVKKPPGRNRANLHRTGFLPIRELAVPVQNRVRGRVASLPWILIAVWTNGSEVMRTGRVCTALRMPGCWVRCCWWACSE